MSLYEVKLFFVLTIFFLDFTRLKLVKSSKEEAAKEQELLEAAEKAKARAEGISQVKVVDEDITARYDAGDDAEVVF